MSLFPSPLSVSAVMFAGFLGVSQTNPPSSLVPRPSASRARTAYVTFEPLSDKNIAGRRPGTTPTSFTSKVDTVVKLLDYK